MAGLACKLAAEFLGTKVLAAYFQNWNEKQRKRNSPTSCMNFSNFVCIPQYRNSTLHNLYAHMMDFPFGSGIC